jgi:cytochrome P450
VTLTATKVSIGDLPFLDMSSEDYAARSYEILRKLREETWVARTDEGILMLSYEAVREIVADSRFRRPGKDTYEIKGITSGPGYDFWSKSLPNLEGDTHKRLRKMVISVFSVQNVDRYRPMMRDIVTGLAGSLPVDHPFDFVGRFADKLPMTVAGTLIGAPERDHELLRDWTAHIEPDNTPLSAVTLPIINAAVTAMREYVGGLAADRRKSDDVGTDLLGRLISIQRRGGELTDEELVDLVAILIHGGHDTTRYQLGHSMAMFLERPDLWVQLAQNPEFAEHAATEMLRFRPALPENLRVPVEDVVFNGLFIPKGTHISLSNAAANRDLACAAGGEEFQLDRPITDHVTFGRGAHFCPGHALARAEIEEVFRTLPKLMPVIRSEGPIEWKAPRRLSGPERIPMSFSTSS